jgi:hypothetical protein
MIFQGDFPLSGKENPCQKPQKRTFSGSIGTEDTEKITAGDIKRDVVQNRQTGVLKADIVYANVHEVFREQVCCRKMR